MPPSLPQKKADASPQSLPQKKADASPATAQVNRLIYESEPVQYDLLKRKSAPGIETRSPIMSKFADGGGVDGWMVTPGMPDLLERVSKGEMVANLEVSNRFGTIKFVDPVNVSGLDMDAAFVIEKRQAAVRSQTQHLRMQQCRFSQLPPPMCAADDHFKVHSLEL
jgi:hypothetical protein